MSLRSFEDGVQCGTPEQQMYNYAPNSLTNLQHHDHSNFVCASPKSEKTKAHVFLKKVVGVAESQAWFTPA